MVMMQFHIIFLIKTTENGNRGEIMEKRKTRFNEFGCDKVHHIPREETYRLMYSTEIYGAKNITDNFRMNGEVIKGVRL